MNLPNDQAVATTRTTTTRRCSLVRLINLFYWSLLLQPLKTTSSAWRMDRHKGRLIVSPPQCLDGLYTPVQPTSRPARKPLNRYHHQAAVELFSRLEGEPANYDDGGGTKTAKRSAKATAEDIIRDTEPGLDKTDIKLSLNVLVSKCIIFIKPLTDTH